MAIPQRSFYHGAALAEITEDPHFTSINRIARVDCSSAYQVNHNIGIYIKYSATPREENVWHFTFTPDHQDEVRTLFDIYGDKTYLVFVCNDVGICIVEFGVFASIVDMNHRDNEWCEVFRPNGGSFRVRGARGAHRRAIPINSFPRVLFDSL